MFLFLAKYHRLHLHDSGRERLYRIELINADVANLEAYLGHAAVNTIKATKKIYNTSL